jgi:hypothetical protein
MLEIAGVGLLLSAAALCGFGCWGIYALVISARQIAAGTDATVKAATGTLNSTVTAEQKIGAVADNLDGLIAETRPKIATALVQLDAASGQIEKTSAGLNAAVAELNAPCVPGPCGTLADVNRTLGSIRLASGQVTAFSLKEQTQLDQANKQETAIAELTEADLAKLGTAIDGIDALATNKDLTGSLAHTNTALGAVAGMATDTQQYWHDTLHPKWPKRVWTFATGAGLSAAKLFF